MNQTKLKPIEIGFGENKVVFHMRMVSVAESDQLDNRFADIKDKDEDKYQQQFEICREALGTYSCAMPQRIVIEKGEPKRVPLVDDATLFSDAIDTYFAERTPENERIIRTAYNVWQSQLTPDFRFLPHSGS